MSKRRVVVTGLATKDQKTKKENQKKKKKEIKRPRKPLKIG
ncbi:hypothetical protein [Escherichia coli]|nr:hypothetical protein [Escherichia coli]